MPTPDTSFIDAYRQTRPAAFPSFSTPASSLKWKQLFLCSLAVNVGIVGAGTLFVARRGGLDYLKAQLKITGSTSGLLDNAYFSERRTIFAAMPRQKAPIVFLGDSLVERCPWNELLQRNDILVRGIGGEDIDGVTQEISEVARHKPKQIFVMAGTNDVIQNKTNGEVVADYQQLLASLKRRSPQSEIVVQSILPIGTKVFAQYPADTAEKELRTTNGQIAAFNKRIRAMTNGKQIIYCDVAGAVKKGGQLNPQFTSDGIHLNAKGYLKWKKAILPLIES